MSPWLGGRKPQGGSPPDRATGASWRPVRANTLRGGVQTGPGAPRARGQAIAPAERTPIAGQGDAGRPALTTRLASYAGCLGLVVAFAALAIGALAGSSAAWALGFRGGVLLFGLGVAGFGLWPPPEDGLRRAWERGDASIFNLLPFAVVRVVFVALGLACLWVAWASS